MRHTSCVLIFSIYFLASVKVFATTLDLPGAYFRPGHPIKGESIYDALDPERSEQSLRNLKTSADRLIKYSANYFEVAGHADAAECEPAECRYLSARRAQVVFRHLLRLGVDPMRLDSMSGWGTTAPIVGSGSKDIWRNRRVDINVSN
nr:OmpA family protein [Chiayiivirga flava]